MTVQAVAVAVLTQERVEQTDARVAWLPERLAPRVSRVELGTWSVERNLAVIAAAVGSLSAAGLAPVLRSPEHPAPRVGALGSAEWELAVRAAAAG
jgi:hypothetical protein